MDRNTKKSTNEDQNTPQKADDPDRPARIRWYILYYLVFLSPFIWWWLQNDYRTYHYVCKVSPYAELAGLALLPILCILADRISGYRLWSKSMRTLGWIFAIGFYVYLTYWLVQYQTLGTKRSPWETECKQTLKALASAQIALAQDKNGKYGSWEKLVDAGYIEQEYTQDTLIDHYIISTFMSKPSVFNKDTEDMTIPSFTIVAVPVNQKYRLRTFGICEDQYVRVWVGWDFDWSTDKVALNDITMWEPLR